MKIIFDWEYKYRDYCFLYWIDCTKKGYSSKETIKKLKNITGEKVNFNYYGLEVKDFNVEPATIEELTNNKIPEVLWDKDIYLSFPNNAKGALKLIKTNLFKVDTFGSAIGDNKLIRKVLLKNLSKYAEDNPYVTRSSGGAIQVMLEDIATLKLKKEVLK